MFIIFGEGRYFAIGFLVLLGRWWKGVMEEVIGVVAPFGRASGYGEIDVSKGLDTNYLNPLSVTGTKCDVANLSLLAMGVRLLNNKCTG